LPFAASPAVWLLLEAALPELPGGLALAAGWLLLLLDGGGLLLFAEAPRRGGGA
jgi:hypothetical protein